MKSIYHQALGGKFDRLHPELQKKFGITSEQKIMVLGQGRMTEIRGTPALIRPFLHIGAKDHMIFAERGKNVPFTLENYSYVDEQGFEAISYIRRFFFPYAIRGFDAVMSYDPEQETVVDNLGKSGRLSTVMELDVTKEGGLLMRSREMKLNNQFTFTGPHTSLYEHYDEKHQALRVHVHVEHPLLGTLLMYEGLVHTEFLPITPNHIPERGILT
ncbi:DUF4166 domain-containing protein [Halobacillus shinanisalinarum]|uniref:DUF4166 domain-containing protein n=1 Tax=Halobacillus shinanisalinarum TaxID=2932258 RepID=A0ABY4H430_9BACI|nr:DUF4166 domain-containing protein [Halobacillus shinanisalinarum]UOQ95216.1 DUF4166 domain-containing protein [Halobacillus shinanisalinarum]